MARNNGTILVGKYEKNVIAAPSEKLVRNFIDGEIVFSYLNNN